MNDKSFLKKLKSISIGSSMADMALLLLVFFMATTTTEPPKGVEVDLPIAKARGAEQDSVYITISKNGVYYIDGMATTSNELGNILASRPVEKDRAVSITADKNLDYRAVKKLLNILQNLEFLNVVFMSQPGNDGGVL